MPNYGHCKNCWWYKRTKNPGYKIEDGKLIPYIGEGICYMHSGNIWSKGAECYHYTNDECYCPDYWNRKKGNKEQGTLDEWIKGGYDKFNKNGML